MRKSRYEQGYALLIVLFLIVFIMTVSAVFIRGTLGNAKQEIKVDDSHLTVMAAEAGVDYYKTYISNFYYSIIPDLELFVQRDLDKQLNDTKNKNKVVDYNKTRENVTSELKRIFNEKILELKLEKNIALYNFNVETTSVKGYPERHTVTVAGTSMGRGKGTEKKVLFEQSFNIPDFSGSPNSSGGGMLSPPNMYKLYPDNVAASSCEKNNKKLSKVTCKSTKDGGYDSVENNSTIYFPDGYKSPNGNFNVSYSKLYSKGAFEVHVFNNLIGSDLNIDGSFKVENNMNNIKDSSIKMNGSMDINSNVQNMTNSEMIIRGAVHIKGHLKMENSLICASGSSKVEGNLTIGQGSKLIHWDHFIVNGKKDIKGEMIQVNSENEVWEKCKLENGNSGNPVYWESPIIKDVSYE